MQYGPTMDLIICLVSWYRYVHFKKILSSTNDHQNDLQLGPKYPKNLGPKTENDFEHIKNVFEIVPTKLLIVCDTMLFWPEKNSLV